MQEYFFCLPFLLFPLFIGIALYSSSVQRRRFEETLRQLCLETGCELKQGSWISLPSMSGSFRGRNVLVDVISRGSGKHRHAYTRIQAFHKGALTEDITLSPENVLSWLGKKLGMADAQLGSQDFDEKYVIGTHNASEAMRIVSPDIQQKLLQTKATVTIGRQAVRHEELKVILDKERIRNTLELLCDIADKVDKT